MKRYISIEHNDGTILAYSENENWKNALSHEEVACWVWQYSESREDAMANHVSKHEEWESDVNKGEEEKSTY
jgi:hypothetical protein